jgi:hypothetical protein
VADHRKEVEYLRRKARQFRALAASERSNIAQQLLDIALELEMRANELEDEAS